MVVVVIWEFSVLLWSKPFTFKLKFWNYTVKKISDQNPARTRTAAHFTVIAGFQYEGFLSLFFPEIFPEKIRMVEKIPTI